VLGAYAVVQAIDQFVKAFRASQQPHWERQEASAKAVLQCAVNLVERYLVDGDDVYVHAAQLTSRTILSAAKVSE
jgi:hypothetical protein